MRFMIHTYPKRLWYVEGYLIPSMVKQGISKADIEIWNDTAGVGNLESCMQCFLSMPNNDDGTWHLQDDVAISKTFAERTSGYGNHIVCGFCNDAFDGVAVKYPGLVPIDYGWFSFQCNRIPNRFARQCAEWFYNEVVPKGLYPEFTKDGKCDDTIWYKFACKHLCGQLVYNVNPNLVDHVDYLLGGSIINKERTGVRRAYYWDEDDTIEALKTWLSRR